MRTRACLARAAVTAFVCVALATGGASAASPAVVAGNQHGAGLHADGSVRTWGDDRLGQLASGTTATASSAVRVNGMPALKPGSDSLGTGDSSAFAIASDGSLWSWGWNQEGMLGDGTMNDRSTPARVNGITNVVSVAAASAHAVAATADGSVWTWGWNGYGQLGSGSTSSRTTPGRVNGLSGITAVAAGVAHTVALRNDGTVWAWGSNSFGQLGTSAAGTSTTPVQVAGLSGITRIAAGGFHTLALKSDGSVWQWGNHMPTPTQIPNLVAVRIAEGGQSSTGYGTLTPTGNTALAVKADGTVWTWSVGSTGPSAPTQWPYWTNVVDVRMSSGVTPIALRSDGRVLVVAPLGGEAPPLAGVSGVTAIATGSAFGLAATSDGALYSWGSNSHGQLGLSQQLNRSTPIVAQGIDSVIQLAAGYDGLAALRSDGTVWAWGSNTYNQLGLFGISTSPPLRVQGIDNVVQIAAGDAHYVALRSDGTVWAWGENTYGQIGDGTASGDPGVFTPFTPRQVASLTNVVYISAGHESSFAVRSDGSLWAWGRNDMRQLGFATSGTCGSVQPLLPCARLPGLVPGITNVVSLATGPGHTIAARNDGTLFSWGDNRNGELGDGTFASRGSPAAVPGVSGVLRVAAAGYICGANCGGGGHSIALKSDGTVLSWGYNRRGQLGDGTTTSHATPRAIAGLADIVSVAAGNYHGAAVRRDGTVLSWGDNSWGQLGDGTYALRTTPAVALREGGAGSIAANDWFLDLDPSINLQVSGAPSFLTLTTGTTTGNILNVISEVLFRTQDVGNSIHVFAYAPAFLVKNAVGAKDGTSCVLSQLGGSGLQQVAAGNLAPYGNVNSAQRQAVGVLNNAPSSPVAGATFCVGAGATGAQSVASGNNVCVATIPPANEGDPTCTPPASAATVAPPSYQALWWNPAESGWGVNIAHQGDKLFATWFTYDADRSGMWLVMSNSSHNADGSYSGALARTTGPTFSATPWSSGGVAGTEVGSARFTFTDASHATFAYTVNNVSQTKSIQRLDFAAPVPTCSVGGDAGASANYSDLWWASPAGSENGWGLNIVHQGDIVFATWYTYGAGNKGMWLSMSDGRKTSTATYSGTLQRSTGPAFSASPWNASEVTRPTVGTASLTFADSNNGTFAYVLDGISQSKAITRLIFAAPGTVCR